MSTDKPAEEGKGSVLHLHHHSHTISRAEREQAAGHRSAVVWLTGLSGSGKSTLANALEAQLFREGTRTYILDGDNVRLGLNSDLDFSEAGRAENIRRIAEVAKLFCDAGVLVITCFISPFRADRGKARAIVNRGSSSAGEDFLEVLVQCPLECCEGRDPKGLYKKARQGIIPDFTGVSSPYEPPERPELIVDTSTCSIDECVQQLLGMLRGRGLCK